MLQLSERFARVSLILLSCLGFFLVSVICTVDTPIVVKVGGSCTVHCVPKPDMPAGF